MALPNVVNLAGELEAQANAAVNAAVAAANAAAGGGGGGGGAQGGGAAAGGGNKSAERDAKQKAEREAGSKAPKVSAADIAKRQAERIAKQKAMLAGRVDPGQAQLFRVKIDGIDVADFLECTGLKDENDVVDYQEGGENTFVHRFRGQTKFANITLRRGVVGGGKALWDWRTAVAQQGRVLRKNVTIELFDDQAKAICTYQLKNAWPCRWTGPDLKGNTSALAIEALELVHEGLTITRAD